MTVLILLTAASPLSFTQGKGQIEQKFKNKTLFLRGFYSENKLKYDAQGNIQGHPKQGSWELALIQIEGISAKPDEFRIFGRRLASIYNSADKKFTNVIPKHHETIDIDVEASADALSPAQLDDLAQKIFLPTLTYKEVPKYWQDFFMGKTSLLPRSSTDPIPGLQWNGQPVHRLKLAQGVAAPTLRKRSEPQYTPTARKQGLQGTNLMRAILDEHGVCQNIQIIKRLGMGLDDAAVEAVKDWRFTPALISGKPTPVLIQIEVNFRLR